MEILRKPGQGVYNILRFNWHFYVIAVVVIVITYALDKILKEYVELLPTFFYLLIVIPTLLSLLVSFYIYDLSGLYKFKWLDENPKPDQVILNIHAGFDETSHLLRTRYHGADILIFDFYDPEKHTEVSIERARKAYKALPGTQNISTMFIPVQSSYADKIFLIFAAHEIRDQAERIVFFKEIYRALKPNGELIVVEHLRDWPNFLAYNVGFFHFLPLSEWHQTFSYADFDITRKKKLTPFVTVFNLGKNGIAS